MASGKLIVIYGTNNLGKTTQARILVDRLASLKLSASYLKYPLYNLEPSGPMLNEYLRKGNPQKLSARESQIIYILNRTQYDAALRERLEAGEWIVAEDYVSTGIAWGMGGGVSRAFTEGISRHLLKEDLAVLLDGERFLQSKEVGHLHEEDTALIERVRKAHQELARDYGWVTIDANQSIEKIAEEVWNTVLKTFHL